MSILRAVLFAVLASSVVACSGTPTVPEPVPVLIPRPEAARGDDLRNPFSLTVVDDYNDGTHLYVRAKVHADAEWPLSDVSVRFTGFHEGEEKASSVSPLSVLLKQSGKLDAGEDRDIVLSLPAPDLTDYQIELVWGKGQEGPEVAAALSAAAPALELRALSLERAGQGCESPPCTEKLKLRGQFFNAGNALLHEATLAVGFVWVPSGQKLDLSGKIPEDEQQVAIPNLNLAPGAKRPFALVFNRAVPASSDGRIEPRVRVATQR